jgi:hypothetical protein
MFERPSWRKSLIENGIAQKQLFLRCLGQHPENCGWGVPQAPNARNIFTLSP